MSQTLNEGRVELACLLYAAAPRKTAPTVRDTEKAVAPLLVLEKAHAAEAAHAIRAAITRLVENGELSREGARIALTGAGRERCNRELGVSFPNRKSWSGLKKHLLAHALVAPPLLKAAVQRLPEHLAGLVLNREEPISTTKAPTTTQVADALAWRELGGDPKVKPSWPQARRLLLARKLGAPPGGKEDVLVRTLAARSLGATRATAAALEAQVLATWSARADGGSSFAARVLASAADPSTQRFGDNKAFIASVFDTYRREHADIGWDDFGRQLLSAHRAGELRLARADLVPAMDRQLVDRSELSYENATFHFVEVQ